MVVLGGCVLEATCATMHKKICLNYWGQIAPQVVSICKVYMFFSNICSYYVIVEPLCIQPKFVFGDAYPLHISIVFLHLKTNFHS